jgi:probable F420-dependent oxidoreductase
MLFSGVAMSGPTVGHHVAIGKEAERLGYESAWVTEVSGPDAVTVLAAAAAATTTIRLATGIVPTYVRDPYLAAMTFASLQDLSGGRVVAGFGTSTPVIVSGWHGLPWGRPVATTREYVTLFRRLLSGERVKHEGIFRLQGATLRAPVREPIPVYLGALNNGMLELAGEIADGVILNFPTPGYTRGAVEAIRRGLTRSGRDRSEIDIVVFLRTGVTDSFEAIATPVRRELLTYCLTPVYQKVFGADGYGADVEAVNERWRAGDRANAPAAISDRMVADHAVIGSVGECNDQVRAYLELDVDHAVLFPVVSDGPAAAERALETVRALGPS